MYDNIISKIKTDGLRCKDINIRDPFVLFENGKYYMYGTRAKDFGRQTGGFDVYVSFDLDNWSEPIECFNSEHHSMNNGVNWAPEVHKYNGKYYMFATFTRKSNNLRGTYILKADSPLGPFKPHSDGAVTPEEWECLDGTLYVSKDNKPYIIFCHEHTQIVDGTICFAQLRDDLTDRTGEPVTMFAASSCPWVDQLERWGHFVTDGPFMYRTKTGELFMIWSSFIKNKYAECLAAFTDGELGMTFKHLPPIITEDGGHGMLFDNGDQLYLTLHTPNESGSEHPVFIEMEDLGDRICIK